MLLDQYEGIKKKREAMERASDRDQRAYNELTRQSRRFPLLGAYDLCLKCSHLFNLLDARGAISVTERVGVIARVRALAVGIAKAWMDQQYSSEEQNIGQASKPGAKEEKGKLAPVVT